MQFHLSALLIALLSTACGSEDEARPDQSKPISLNLSGVSDSSFRWSDYSRRNFLWYASDEAKEIAEAVITWQFESGGWYKENNQRSKRTTPLPNKSATIDNDATTSQLQYLLRIQKVNKLGGDIMKSIEKGIDYLLEAQLDIGGWPQVYPKDDSYRDASTFNDDAIVNVMKLFKSIIDGRNKNILDNNRVIKVRTAYEKGLNYIRRAQITSQGRPTGWCQQYDPKQIKCVKARSYEHPGIAGRETAEIVRFLKANDPEGSKDVIANAVDWLKEVAIENMQWKGSVNQGRPTFRFGSVIWARYYDLKTQEPFFSGRDGKITNDITKIEKERREGYGWYGSWARDLIKEPSIIVDDPKEVNVAGVDFEFKSNGRDFRMNCTGLKESADPHSWNNNYLCTSEDLGVRFKTAGSIQDMDCTNLNEESDREGTWFDNYLCLPKSSAFKFTWSSEGPIDGKECLSMYEEAEPYANSWWDNFLCVEEKGDESDEDSFSDSLELRFYTAGEGPGFCTRINESADPHTWDDNYLCSNLFLGLKFNSAREISGMNCVQLDEPYDREGTWFDNYLCLPADSKIKLTWSNSGMIAGKKCIRINEAAEPRENNWWNNYLCYEDK